MATKDEPLPETMISPETGETLARGVRPFTVAYKGESVVVDLPGYYPERPDDSADGVARPPSRARRGVEIIAHNPAALVRLTLKRSRLRW
jgi:hypothetical protein